MPDRPRQDTELLVLCMQIVPYLNIELTRLRISIETCASLSQIEEYQYAMTEFVVTIVA